MAYLQPADYPNYGLPDGTTADWITAATALINSYCRRPDLNVIQYTERLRLVSGRADGAAELSAAGAAGRGDDADREHSRAVMRRPRRGEMANEPLVRDCVGILAAGTVDRDRSELCGLRSEHRRADSAVECVRLAVTTKSAVTYTAGLATIGDDVKTACAQIVRNAQSTPALNASKTKIDTMQMQYFSSSLVDETVQAWLRPYVANRLG